MKSLTDTHLFPHSRSIRERVFALQKAYKAEFAGNIKSITREAAEAWARDYPEIFKKYIEKGI